MGKEINRRDFFGFIGRGSLAVGLGGLFGKRVAIREVKSQQAVENSKRTSEEALTDSKEKEKKTVSPSDARALRHAYSSSYAYNTGLAATATFGGMSLMAAQANNTQEKIEAAIDQNVPCENRPAEMQDMTKYSSRTTRRAALAATARGLLAGSILGPLITYFSNPGNGVAELIHGNETENDTLEQRTERTITANDENRKALLRNSLGTGGLVSSLSYMNDMGNVLKNEKEVAFQAALTKKVVEPEGFSFTVNDLTLKCNDLERLLPPSLKVVDTVLGVNLVRKGCHQQNLVLVYKEEEKGKGFYLRDLGGNYSFTAVPLKWGDQVTIRKVG